MEWTYLEKLWARSVNPATVDTTTDSWNQEIEALYSLGIGMEKTLRFLYQEKPELSAFKTWIENQSQKQVQIVDDSTGDVLTREDLDFWEENGYVVVKQVISSDDCIETRKAILEFLGMEANNRDSWYRAHDEWRGLMLTFTDHPTLERNRQSVRIRKAYEQLYGTSSIFMSIDKVSFNPPETAGFSFKGSPLHWDISLQQPIPLSLQGLLYLTDCGAQDGAFQCVPGFHKRIGSWLEQLPPHELPREVAPFKLQGVPVTGQAGDFVIWHAALPHGATANRGTTPRMVQYLTYLPNGYKEESEWI